MAVSKGKTGGDTFKAFPCFQCPLYKKSSCNISQCKKIEKYERTTEIPINLQNSKRYDSYEEHAREIGKNNHEDQSNKDDGSNLTEGHGKEKIYSLESPLADFQDSKIGINDISSLIYKYKIIRECETNLREQFDSFLECEYIARIAELAGDSRQNLSTKINRRIIKLLKKTPSKNRGIPIPDMTPEKFKESLGLRTKRGR